jgi:MATE family multidrug resistance protein
VNPRIETQNWWNRPAGGREVCRLALPLVLSTASWAVMNFVDRMMLLWHSPAEMAASLPASTLFWTLIALPLGIASYANTFVAQYHGAGRLERIGDVIRHGARFGWAMMPLFLLLIPVAPWGFRWLGHSEELVAGESTYLQVNCCGAGAVILAGAYSSFYTGRGQTATVMWIDVAASVLNVLLDWLWIFGKFGFPEMGIAGAAAATVVSQWGKVAVYLALFRQPNIRLAFGFDRPLRFDGDLMRRLLRYGTPSGFQMLIEGLAFTLFVLGIGQLGTVATAATSLAISINIVAFVPMMGASIAVSTLVGNYLGADQPELAARATWSGIWLALLYNLVFAVLYLGVPEWFLWAHQLGSAGEDFTEIRDLSVVLLRFVAAYCLFDAIQLMLCGALKGAGDMRFVLVTTLSAAVAAVSLGQFGASQFGLGILWWWTVLMLWILALAAVYCGRFLQGKWKQMRVIESEVRQLQRFHDQPDESVAVLSAPQEP